MPYTAHLFCNILFFVVLVVHLGTLLFKRLIPLYDRRSFGVLPFYRSFNGCYILLGSRISSETQQKTLRGYCAFLSFMCIKITPEKWLCKLILNNYTTFRVRVMSLLEGSGLSGSYWRRTGSTLILTTLVLVEKKKFTLHWKLPFVFVLR